MAVFLIYVMALLHFVAFGIIAVYGMALLGLPVWAALTIVLGFYFLVLFGGGSREL